MKTALIFGITGQDGSYLARYLLSLNYRVHGLIRRNSLDNRARIQDILPNITLHAGDMADSGSILQSISASKPHEIYNLAAQTHVHTSFSEPEHTADINALAVVRTLDIIRHTSPQTRFYQAATSELFGNSSQAPLTENSPMHPASPYAAAKLYAYHLTRQYREAYGLFACNGILFNHESPVRGDDFVTAKIAHFARKVANNTWQNTPLKLGNLNARRDWGHAHDYVRGMHAMLQHPSADDYILATGTAHSVKDFANAAFTHIGQPLNWKDDKAYLPNGALAITSDPAFLRPLDVECLIGDASKAKQTLGWQPQISFLELVADMVGQA